jgi:hypothetical protein
MKPIALITRYVDPAVIDLLTSVCEVMPRVALDSHSHQEITLLDVLAGDTPRGALNEVLQRAA